MVDIKTTDDPKSPCIRHCCLDENDVCLGCFRTLNEIIHWQASNVEEKHQIIAQCQQRRVARRR